MKLKLTAGLFLLFLAFIVTARTTVIKFDLKYEFAKGGEVLLTINDTVFNNRPAIRYHFIGRSTGLTDALYKINDEYETFVDAETMLPLKALRNVREGKYKSYNITWFYHKVDSIYSLKKGWEKVPNNLTDIVSVFFYYSHFYLKNNIVFDQPLTLPCYQASKIYNISIKNLGERIIKTDLGPINTFALSPLTEKGKLLKRSDALLFYISKEQKIPVQLEFDTKFGDLIAVLRSYKVDGIEQVKKLK